MAASSNGALHRWAIGAYLASAFAAYHAFRTAELYLAPTVAWVAPLATVALGALVLRLRWRADAAVPYLFVGAALSSLACSFVPFVAFGWPGARVVTFACVGTSCATLAPAVGLATRSVVGWSWALGLPAYVLHPFRVFVLGALCFAALALPASSGHLRSGLWIAAALSAVSASFAPRHAALYGRTFAGATAALAASAAALSLAVAGHLGAARLLPQEELAVYAGEIIHARWGATHRYVVTAVPAGHELFEDAALVASPLDGARRASALVEPALRAAPSTPRRALVLFGGLGAIERELAKARIASVTVVVDDAELGRVAAGLDWMPRDDGGARIVVAEPLPWLRDHPERWDVIVANLPPPLDHRAGKYYTRHFFRLVAERLEPGGAVSLPAVSALTARAAFEDVLATARDAGLDVTAHHAALPALGLASFLAGRRAATRAVTIPGAFDAGADLVATGNGAVARLHDQRVVESLEMPAPPVVPK